MPRALKKAVIAFSGMFVDHDKNATPDRLRKWCEANGAVYQTALNNDTTHLVVSERNWKSRVSIVAEALTYDKLHIVPYSWFEDSLASATKKDPRPYLWSKREAAAQKKAQQKKKFDEREKVRKEKLSKRINWSEAVVEHTDDVTGRMAGTKVAADFAKGAKAAKADVHSENHHIYRDETGFAYAIILSKVHLSTNRNERVTLIIYESNSAPHTYATHVRTSGTKLVTAAETIAVLGSNWPTAFRVFRKVFKEKTEVEWEKRVEGFAASRKRGAGIIKGMEAESVEEKKKRVEREWRDMPFSYRIPAEGEPRGTMPEPEGEVEGVVGGGA